MSAGELARDAAGRSREPRELCVQLAREFAVKADHNKAESQLFFAAVIVSSLSSPAFVMLGEGWVLGKLAPTVLSLVAAGAAAWIQIRKPQQLWAIYRDAQRRLEYQHALHDIQSGLYESEDRDRKLVEAVLRIKMRAHEKWLALVPSPEHLPVGVVPPRRTESDDSEQNTNLPQDETRRR